MTMQKISSRIYGNYAKSVPAVKRIPMDIQRVEQASGNIYRVIVSVPAVDGYRRRLSTDSEVASSVSSKFKGQVRYLPDSLTATEVAGVYSMFVAGVIPVMNAEVASSANLVEIATNVFKDDTDCIWELVEDASGNMNYVSRQEVDYTSVLNAARSANIVTASMEVATADTFKSGQILSFYDVATASKRTGIAVTDHEVFVPDADNIVPVSPIMVLAATDDRLTVNLSSANSKTAVLDYMRAIYGNNSALFKSLKTLIAQNLAV